MSEGYPRLLGHIGGTHARWACEEVPEATPADVVIEDCGRHPALLGASRALDQIAGDGAADQG